MHATLLASLVLPLVLGAPQLIKRGSQFATFYPDMNQGACGWQLHAEDHSVALGPDEYAGGALCGQTITINGDVTATVADMCEGCERGHIDMTPSLFLKFATKDQGVVDISYTLPGGGGGGGDGGKGSKGGDSSSSEAPSSTEAPPQSSEVPSQTEAPPQSETVSASETVSQSKAADSVAPTASTDVSATDPASPPPSGTASPNSAPSSSYSAPGASAPTSKGKPNGLAPPSGGSVNSGGRKCRPRPSSSSK